MHEPSTTTTNLTAPADTHCDAPAEKVHKLGTLLLKEVAQSKQQLALYVINSLIAEAKDLGRWEQMKRHCEYAREAEKRKRNRQHKRSSRR